MAVVTCLSSCTTKEKPHIPIQDSTITAQGEKAATTIPIFDKDSLRIADAEMLVQHIYDTVDNSPQTDSMEDTITRDDASLKYFKDHSGQYYVYVVENRGPMYGVSLGWCDLFIFKRLDGLWKLNDFRLQAGGGGMYGNPGSFEKFEQIGEESKAIVISGGQTHMGNNFNLTMVELTKGKLGTTFSFPTRSDYGEGAGDDYKLKVCDENQYHFRKMPGKKYFELILERFNCLNDNSVKVDSVVIPYRNGYAIPERFAFEG
ncbi:hypothetical protein [Pedobacter duraquae]|nr:hypothetical protein [Pedobacter duraquae]